MHAEGMAQLQPSLHTTKEKQDYAKELSPQAENLDISQLSVLLQVANGAQGTNFQLGFVAQGYRGRWSRENDGKFDNTFLQKTAARMADFEMADQPMLWIFSDNVISRENAWGNSGDYYNHWVSLSPEDSKKMSELLLYLRKDSALTPPCVLRVPNLILMLGRYTTTALGRWWSQI